MTVSAADAPGTAETAPLPEEHSTIESEGEMGQLGDWIEDAKSNFRLILVIVIVENSA